MDEFVEHREIEVLKPQDITNHIGNVKLGIRKYIEKEEIDKLLSEMPPGRDKMMIITLWMSGIRVGELISIKKGDIDFQNNTVRIKWLKNRKYQERIIPIKKELCSMLSFYSAGLLSESRVFPLSRQRVHKIVNNWLGTHPHTLRHSFAVNFLRQSSSATALVILQRLLGHKRIQTTMEYLKIVPSDMALELEKIKF